MYYKLSSKTTNELQIEKKTPKTSTPLPSSSQAKSGRQLYTEAVSKWEWIVHIGRGCDDASP